MKKFRAVIFDMDGLVLDNQRIAYEAWRAAALECGVELPESVFVDILGRDEADSNRILRERLGPSFPVERVRARRRELGDEFLRSSRVPMKPGVPEVLALLDERGIARCLATSTRRELALERLTSAGLLSRFPLIVTGDEVRAGKPAPDIFLLAASRLCMDPAACLVLEDSEWGIEGAVAAGMAAVLIPDMKPPSERAPQHSLRIFPSLLSSLEFLRSVL